MAKLHSIAPLVIASLLAVLCKGKRVQFVLPQCPTGYLDTKTINAGILDPVNGYRHKLAQGTQVNGRNGFPAKLPPATRMPVLQWGCELEQTAIKALGDGNCQDPVNQTGPNSGGKGNVFYANEFVGGTIEEAIATFLANSLEVINVQSLPVKTQGTVLSNPLFDSTTNLKAYANV
ncbi:hypothetical protein ANCCAN_11013, partial [Ancylostoma caninum]